MQVSNMQISYFAYLISWKDRHHQILQFKPLLDLIHKIKVLWTRTSQQNIRKLDADELGGRVEKRVIKTQRQRDIQCYHMFSITRNIDLVKKHSEHWYPI